MVNLTGPILLLATLCILLFTTPISAETEQEWSNYRNTCSRKDGRITSAVERLCSKDLHIPGPLASMGENFESYNKISITTSSACRVRGLINSDSNIWVPKYWCERQFWKTCAQGNEKGRATQNFGGRGCQMFVISDWKKKY